MGREHLHPVLRRKLLLNRCLGTPLMGLIAAGIFLSVFNGARGGQEPVGLLLLRSAIGALFVWAACYAWASGAWYRRVSWVMLNCPAVEMRASFGFIPAGALVVSLRDPGRGDLVSPPKWPVDESRERTVKARIDPKEGGPVIIETEQGVLWPLERSPSRREKAAAACPEG